MVVDPLADSKGRAFGGVLGNAPHITSKRLSNRFDKLKCRLSAAFSFIHKR